jgi:RNA polymerase sigma factor (sigma-70 family)
MKNIPMPTPCDEYQLNPKKLIEHLRGTSLALEKQAIECLLSKIIPKVQDLYGSYVENITIREQLNSKAFTLFKIHLKQGKISTNDDFKTLISLCLQDYFKPKYLKWCQDDYTRNREKFLEHLLANKKMAMDCLENLAYPECMGMNIMKRIERYDDKEEVFQEALIGFLNSIRKENYKTDIEGKSLISYFKSIMYYKAIDFLRKQKPKEDIDRILEFDEDNQVRGSSALVSATNNSSYYDEEKLNAYRECLNTLPPHYKIVVSAKTLDDWSHKEIGDELGTSESSSANMLAKAIKLLKKCIKSKGF